MNYRKPSSLYLLLLSTGFLFIGDAILSYLFPVIVEDTVNSFLLVGIILAISSIVGLICDLLFPVLFNNMSWRTSNLIGISLGFSFPILLFLGHDLGQPLLFVAAAAVWGVYIEFLGFSRQECVIGLDKQRNFTKTWSLFYSILSLSAFIGPIIASVTLSADQVVARTIVFLLYSVALIFAVLLSTRRTPNKIKKESKIVHTISFLREVKYWVILESKTYPIIIMLVSLTIVNAFFWGFGGLYGEQLFGSGLGWLLLVAYTLPELILSLALSRMVIKRRKKYLSYIFLILSGIAILPLLFIHDSVMLLIAVLIFSSFNCIALILTRAVFSDLETRSDEFKVYVEAVQQSTHSIGYIVGPLLAGFLVQIVGFRETFIIMGIGFIVIGVFLVTLTPDKLRIPKARLRSI